MQWQRGETKIGKAEKLFHWRACIFTQQISTCGTFILKNCAYQKLVWVKRSWENSWIFNIWRDFIGHEWDRSLEILWYLPTLLEYTQCQSYNCWNKKYFPCIFYSFTVFPLELDYRWNEKVSSQTTFWVILTYYFRTNKYKKVEGEFCM